MLELWGMFIGAFLAATLLPGGSEILLLMLLKQNPENWPALSIVSTLGNTLGAITSFYLGRLGRFAKTPEQLSTSKYKTAISLITKYGYWGLLLSWMPIIGDMLCLLAGWLKLPLLKSILMILLGKGARYLFLVVVFFYWP